MLLNLSIIAIFKSVCWNLRHVFLDYETAISAGFSYFKRVFTGFGVTFCE